MHHQPIFVINFVCFPDILNPVLNLFSVSKIDAFPHPYHHHSSKTRETTLGLKSTIWVLFCIFSFDHFVQLLKPENISQESKKYDIRECVYSIEMFFWSTEDI